MSSSHTHPPSLIPSLPPLLPEVELVLLLTKNGDLLKESLVEFPLANGAAHEDASIGVSVDCP